MGKVETAATATDVAVNPSMLVDMGQPEKVPTAYGPITVSVSGNRQKTGLVTVHDIALSPASCFQGLVMCAGPESALLQNFCMYHITLPGHEENSTGLPPEMPPVTADKIMDMVHSVVQHFGLKEVLGMGVGFGAHVLFKYAVRYKKEMPALIMISPYCDRAGWQEWANLKAAALQIRFGSVSGWVVETLVARLIHHGMMHQNTDLTKAFRTEISAKNPSVLMHYLWAAKDRESLLPIADGVCTNTRMLVITGDRSPFYQESLELNTHIASRSSFVEVPGCGTLLTEENPHALISPIDLFVQRLQQKGLGL